MKIWDKVNLQNLPHVSKFRNPFKADDKNHKLIIADYSSQELLIVATLAGEQSWLDAVAKGEDLHSANAARLMGQDWIDAAEFNCEFNKTRQKCNCKNHKEMRGNSKATSFSLLYGAGVMKIAEQLNITKDAAKELMSKFFSAFPHIDIFMDDTKQAGIDNLYIETSAPYKRKRYFDAPRDPKEEASIRRKSGNTVIQGTAADMVKLALVLIKNELDARPEWGVQIKMQIHDEIICQAPNDSAELWAKKQVYLMEKAAEIILNHKLLKSTVIISDQWEK